MWCGGSAVKSSKGDFQSHIEVFAVGTVGEKRLKYFLYKKIGTLQQKVVIVTLNLTKIMVTIGFNTDQFQCKERTTKLD